MDDCIITCYSLQEVYPQIQFKINLPIQFFLLTKLKKYLTRITDITFKFNCINSNIRTLLKIYTIIFSVMRQEIKIAKMAEWVDKGKTPQQVFGKFQLKTMQKAILNCLQVSDVIANLPTGFGKSLLFQYPASLQQLNQKCIIVIVPLKALLWDCIRQSKDLGIVAQQIDQSLISAYYRNDKLPQMLVATPEKIFASQSTLGFLESLQSLKKIRLLVIDECHCISQWGHDFRPAYLQLSKLRQILSGVRLLAISATITPETRVDLTKRMFLYAAHYFQASYHRHNLFYGVLKAKDKSSIKETISNFLKQKNLIDEQGIIYCQTIGVAQQLQGQLSTQLKSGLFHSKLGENRRKQVYDNFMSGKIKSIVATICFGMGINKRDIRYVINVGISKSPQNYYQESGRAGRDGMHAYCMTVSFPNQSSSLAFMINKGSMTSKQKSHQLIKLQQIKQYAEQDFQCRRKNLFRKLGQNFNPQNCNKNCDICGQEDQGIVLQKRDHYSAVLKIMEELQTSKPYFTKKQLISFLKGKNVAKKVKNTEKSIFGEEIKGIFKKQTMQTIQKIVDGMISKNLLVQQVGKQTKYFVQYYKPANKSSTRNFKQFYIFVQTKSQPAILEKAGKDHNKFAKFLSKKGVQANEKPKQARSLNQLIQKKVSDDQLLVEAEVVKEKQNYQQFFCDLYGDELMGDLQKRQSHLALDLDDDQNQEQPITEHQFIEEEPQYLEQTSKEEDNSKILEDYILSKLNIEKKKLQQKEGLKRKNIDDKKLKNLQF